MLLSLILIFPSKVTKQLFKMSVSVHLSLSTNFIVAFDCQKCVFRWAEIASAYNKPALDCRGLNMVPAGRCKQPSHWLHVAARQSEDICSETNTHQKYSPLTSVQAAEVHPPCSLKSELRNGMNQYLLSEVTPWQTGRWRQAAEQTWLRWPFSGLTAAKWYKALICSLVSLGCADLTQPSNWLFFRPVIAVKVLLQPTFAQVWLCQWTPSGLSRHQSGLMGLKAYPPHFDALQLKRMNNAGLQLCVSEEGAGVTCRCPSLLPSVMWNKRPGSSMFCSGK